MEVLLSNSWVTEFCFPGLKPNGDTYSKDAFVAFHKTVEGKLSTVEFREKYQDTKSPIEEIVHSVLLTTEGSDVAQGLIQKKLAQGIISYFTP